MLQYLPLSEQPLHIHLVSCIIKKIPRNAFDGSLHGHCNNLRADVSKYRPEVYKSEKSRILKKIHKVALGKLLT